MDTDRLLCDAERDAAAVATVALRMNAPRSTLGNGVYVRTAGGVSMPPPSPSSAAPGDGGGAYPMATRETAGASGDAFLMVDDCGDIYPPTLALLETRSSSSGDDFTLAEALDVIGIGPFQYRLLFTIGLISIATGLGLTGLALFPPLTRCSLHLSSWQEAILTSSALVGMVCGGIGMTHLSTRFGRRKELIVMLVWTSYFGFLSGLTSGFYWLLALRFVVGFGQGGAGQRVFVVFENIHSRHRPLATSILACCLSAGGVLEALAVKFLLPEGGGVAWRYLLFLNALIYLFCIVFQSWIFESPHFLLNIRGDREKAMAALEQAANMNRKMLPPGRLITDRERKLVTLSPHRSTPRHRSDKQHDLFFDGAHPSALRQPSERGDPSSVTGRSSSPKGFFRSSKIPRATTIIAVAWVAVSVAMVGSAILPEEVLQAKALAGGHCPGQFDVYEGKQCHQLTAEQYTPIAIVYASEFPAVLMTYFSAKLLGERVSLVVALSLCGVFFALLVICPTSVWVTTFLLSGARMFAVTAWSLLTAYTTAAAMFPTYMRGLAVSLSAVLFSVASVFVPFLSQVLLRRYMYLGAGLHAGVCVLAAGALLAMPSERKRRNVEESEE